MRLNDEDTELDRFRTNLLKSGGCGWRSAIRRNGYLQSRKCSLGVKV